jgi:hypothetical protein
MLNYFAFSQSVQKTIACRDDHASPSTLFKLRTARHILTKCFMDTVYTVIYRNTSYVHIVMCNKKQHKKQNTVTISISITVVKEHEVRLQTSHTSLVNFQLDAQNSYLFLYNTLIKKSSTCFEHCPAHLQEVYVVIVYIQPLVSSLSAGDCPVHRVRKSSFLTGAQDSHLQRVKIPEAAYIQLRRRPPEDEQGNAQNM